MAGLRVRWWLGWTAGLLLACAGSLAGGCGREAGPQSGAPTEEVRIDAHRTLGEPVEAENLTVWPVYTDQPLDIGEFLTLQEAQAKELAVIREVGGGAGAQQQERVNRAAPNRAPNDAPNDAPAQQSDEQVVGGGDQAVVNTLVIENKGELPILVCAGTIVRGGKQDRQIGQDFVIAAASEVPVDAFCVEQGRWSARAGNDLAAREDSVLQFMASSSNASKDVRMAGQYEKSQDKVWEKVSGTLQRVAGAANDSQTLLEAVDVKDEATAKKREGVEQILRAAFERLAQAERKPVGFAYAVNGKPVTVRVFAHERILGAQLPAFLKAMAMEAQIASSEKATKVATAADVVALVNDVRAAAEKLEETRGDNRNGYRESKLGFNARCYIKGKKAGAEWVAVTEDWTAR